MSNKRTLIISVVGEPDEKVTQLFQWVIGYAYDFAQEDLDISGENVYFSEPGETPTSVK